MSNYNRYMDRSKKIAIDARFYGEAGPGRYVKNIVEHLEDIDSVNTYYVFLSPKGYSSFQPKNKNFVKKLTRAKWYSWAEQTILLIDFLSVRPDLLYVPHFNIPILYFGKLVTAIPDIIMHTYSTEKGTTLPKFYFRLKKYIYRLVLYIALLRSRKVIVPTYDVYHDITSHHPGIDTSKFVVAYEGVDPSYKKNIPLDDEILSKYKLQKNKFMLYVSSMYEHKNVFRLIDAYALLRQNDKLNQKLVLVGKKDKFSQRVEEYISKLGLNDFVIMPGQYEYVTDDDIITLRRNASVYVFPSLKEGFSLTPLEAQITGLPCVISDISCHKEVFGDSVLYFNPYDIQDIVRKIEMILRDSELRANLIALGYKNAEKYDWVHTAKVTYQIFHQILFTKKPNEKK